MSENMVADRARFFEAFADAERRNLESERTLPQVRELARRFELPVAAKSDSQGLCFVGEVSMQDFLSRFITVRPGEVLDRQGAVIGVHQGAALYTRGQRHGFEIRGGATSRGPFYIVSVDVTTNTLRVSSRKEDAESTVVYLSNEDWPSGSPCFPARYETQTRYHERPVFATVARDSGRLTATFEEPHLASPGQSIVFYDGDKIVGGAIIA